MPRRNRNQTEHPLIPAGMEPDPLGTFIGQHSEIEWYTPLHELPGWNSFADSWREALRILPLCRDGSEIGTRLGKRRDWFKETKYRYPLFKQAVEVRSLCRGQDIDRYFLDELYVEAISETARMLKYANGGTAETMRFKVAQYIIDRQDKIKKRVVVDSRPAQKPSIGDMLRFTKPEDKDVA